MPQKYMRSIFFTLRPTYLLRVSDGLLTGSIPYIRVAHLSTKSSSTSGKKNVKSTSNTLLSYEPRVPDVSYDIRRSRDADKIAVLIDGDNAESSLVAEFLAEAGRFGKVTVKRIYADWTSPQMKTWKEELNSHAVRPIQKFAYTKSKNSTDTALIIDAMDLMNSKLVEGFCIVSSDSDYTGLAHRIREEGMFIMGIGKRHTPEAFVKACESFTYSEILVQPTGITSTKKNSTTKIDSTDSAISSITLTTAAPAVAWTPEIDTNLVNRAFRIAMNIDSSKALLSRLNEELRKLDPTFDHRNFGFSSFRKFCESNTLRKYYETSINGTTMLIAEKSLPQKLNTLTATLPKKRAIIKNDEIIREVDDDPQDIECESQVIESCGNHLETTFQTSGQKKVEEDVTRFPNLVSLYSSSAAAPPASSLISDVTSKTISTASVTMPETVPAIIPEIDTNLVNRAFRIAMNIDSSKAVLSRLNEELRKLDPTFDHRNFGFSSFRKFCESNTLRKYYETSINGTTMLIAEKSLPQKLDTRTATLPKKRAIIKNDEIIREVVDDPQDIECESQVIKSCGNHLETTFQTSGQEKAEEDVTRFPNLVSLYSSSAAAPPASSLISDVTSKTVSTASVTMPETVPAITPEIDTNLVNRAFRIAMNIDSSKAVLSRLNIELRKLDSTFDHRNFGFSSFRKFCESTAMKNLYETSMAKDGLTILIAEKGIPQTLEAPTDALPVEPHSDIDIKNADELCEDVPKNIVSANEAIKSYVEETADEQLKKEEGKAASLLESFGSSSNEAVPYRASPCKICGKNHPEDNCNYRNTKFTIDQNREYYHRAEKRETASKLLEDSKSETNTESKSDNPKQGSSDIYL